MIITRTPYRISLFGGGTDSADWLQSERGAVISFSIDKYCYLTAKYLPPFFGYKYRVVYSRTENALEIDEIEHPAIREGIRLFGDGPIEIHHHGDLPARSGIGSSSSFAVGLIHTLLRLKGVTPTKEYLADAAIEFEQSHLKENVGSQDQIAAAVGGFNFVQFEIGGKWVARPVRISDYYLRYLQQNFLLMYTGLDRNSSEISDGLTSGMWDRKGAFEETVDLTHLSLKMIENESDIGQIASLMADAWKLKKEMNPKSSSSLINEIYEIGIKNGALAGKILGAGGGGFIMFVVEPNLRNKVVASLPNLIEVPFQVENGTTGTQSVAHWM